LSELLPAEDPDTARSMPEGWSEDESEQLKEGAAFFAGDKLGFAKRHNFLNLGGAGFKQASKESVQVGSLAKLKTILQAGNVEWNPEDDEDEDDNEGLFKNKIRTVGFDDSDGSFESSDPSSSDFTETESEDVNIIF